MSEGQEWPKLRLKNGSEVDAREAYTKWRALVSTQKHEPQIAEALLAIARGNDRAVSDDLRKHLQQDRIWFSSDGGLLRTAKDVIESSFREAPDGPTFVNPFHLATEADVKVFDRTEQRYYRLLRRLLGGDDSVGHAR
jgi:hypothetical protein